MHHRTPPQTNGYPQNYTNDTTPETSADERSIKRRPANRRSGDYGSRGLGGANSGYDSASSSRSRGPPGALSGARYGGRGGRAGEQMLSFISQQWPFMASDSCMPIKVALQFNDSSSLGLADQDDNFQQVHQLLQNALKGIVNEHHQGFNSSIGTFHKIQSGIHASQHRVRTLRAGLVQAKSSLSTARPELRAFAQTSRSYDRMLAILSDIETLQAVPDQLDALISEKRFLAAVSTLQEALALIMKPEMEDIGALSELRVYLSNQEHSLTDILIEELHSHLYLKSPYCEARWKAHSKRDLNNTGALGGGPWGWEENAMFSFLEQYHARRPMVEDAHHNPEANTFSYLQLLVESLTKLGKLDVAVDQIEYRLPAELFKVVERSHGEVDQRHPATLRSQRQGMKGGVGKGPDGEQKATLEDLLRTLYAKFEAIAEGHRVVHDVTAAILKRSPDYSPDSSSTLNRSFRELWKLLQSEIRSLLHDHLASSGSAGAGREKRGNDPSANIFRVQPRDKSKKLFQLKDTDPNSTDLATEREDLEFIFRSSVPGLVNSSQVQHAKRERDQAEAMGADKSATGHKLLVEPSVFNMGILLPLSLAFLNRLRDILPPGPSSGVVARTLTSFLDDFLINVFYPQLDETLTELCSSSIGDVEAFMPDPNWRKYSQKPVFKGTERFFEVVEAVCSMLDALPHEQSFSSLVVQQMRAYYDRCYQWSRSLLQRTVSARSESQPAQVLMRLAADLATSGEVNDSVIALLQASAEEDEREQVVLAEKESALLINLVKEDGRGVEEADLVNDRKALAALCTMHVSMKWLAARCQGLRFISPRAIDMDATESVDMQGHARQHARRWTQHQNQALPGASAEPTGAYLPLDENTAHRFDAVMSSFTELSTLVLRTLHVDIRLQLLCGIKEAMKNSYVLGQPYNDPDPAILELSNSLSSYDSVIEANLLPAQYRFLTTNLHTLVNNALISLVAIVPGIDNYGISRLQLNVLVLQQALKQLSPTATLSKAADFYLLAEQGPEAVVKEGQKGNQGYDKDDLKRLIALCWREQRDGAQGSIEAFQARLDGANFPKRGASLRGSKRK